MVSRLSAKRGLWLASVASLASIAAPALAQAPEPRIAIHIPAETLGSALRELGRETNTNILFSADAVANLRSPALSGAMSPHQAVDRLIANTRLQAITDGQGAIIIRPSSQLTPAAMLQPTPAPAVVADPAPPRDAPATTAPSEAITTVVVTARRRAEDIQSVPVAVTAFGGKDLMERHITSQVDLANNTPSLIAIQSGYPAELGGFVIRGQGPAFNGTSGTVTYFAEAPDPYLGLDGRPGSYYDLANIQVLKGPQGTLFGKNATGGNVLFEPQRPTNEFGGYIEGQIGNYNERQFDAAVNIPIVDDKVLLRVAGTAERRDGYTTDVGPNFRGKDYDNIAYEGFRVGLTLRPIDGLESYTMFRYQQSNTNGPGTVPFAIAPDAALDAAFPNREADFAAQQARGIREVSYNLNQQDRSYYDQIMNSTTYRLSSDLLIKNIVSYTRDYISYGYDYDASPLPLAGQTSPNQPTESFDYFSEELQLQGKALDKRLQYSIGVFDDNLNNPRSIIFAEDYPLSALLGGPIPAAERASDHSQAAFIQGTYDFGGLSDYLKGLSITAGYRYTSEYTSSSSYILTPPFTGGADAFHYGSYTFDIDYKILPNTLIYATFRDAHKAGGFNSLVPTGSPFAFYPPEELQDKEFGLKSTFSVFGIQARTNIDGFFDDYKNIQRQVVQDVGGVFVQVVESAAQGDLKGLEFEGTLIPIQGLELSLNYSYTSSAYTKTLPIAEGLLQGAPFPYVPTNKVALEARYQLPFVPREYGVVTASEDLTYQSKQSVAQTNQTVYPYMPGFGQLNLRLDWDHVMGRPVGLAFYMTNATNQTSVVGEFDGISQAGFATRTYAPPRMFGAQLRYAFGGR